MTVRIWLCSQMKCLVLNTRGWSSLCISLNELDLGHQRSQHCFMLNLYLMKMSKLQNYKIKPRQTFKDDILPTSSFSDKIKNLKDFVHKVTQLISVAESRLNVKALMHCMRTSRPVGLWCPTSPGHHCEMCSDPRRSVIFSDMSTIVFSQEEWEYLDLQQGTCTEMWCGMVVMLFLVKNCWTLSVMWAGELPNHPLRNGQVC